MRNKKEKQNNSRSLDVAHFISAESLIIRSLQSNAFKDEIVMLQKFKTEDLQDNNRESTKQQNAVLKTSSFLHKLDPFLDTNGVLRAGGRLRRANISDNAKFPIILPRKSHITSLIIMHFHERAKHQGKGITLNEIRSNGYWIVGGSSVITSAITSCVRCKKLRGAVQQQKMSDLPEDRPFTYCAVDCFGPFIVKDKQKELKRYGVLFTCMASRAIHIEIANSLDTDSFLNALRRFISRRGPIRQLCSDQGTNIVGARTELTKALGEMDQDKIKSCLLDNQCDWITFKMNVPAASHMGGVWE